MSSDNSSIQEIFLLRIGSTWLLDTCYVYIVIPFGTIGISLNIICLIVFQSKLMNNINLYKYLRVFTINSLIICVMGLFTFMPRTPRYFPDLSFSFIAKLYRCKIFSFFGYTFVLYGNLLNILIIIERMSIYTNNKILKVLSVCKLCIFMLVLSAMINFPTYFSYNMKSEQEFNDAINDYEKAITFTYCEIPIFFRGIPGKILLGLIAFIRDFVSLILEIIIALISIYYFRKYQLNRRMTIFLNDIHVNSSANLTNNILNLENSENSNNRNSSYATTDREIIPSNLFPVFNRKMEILNNNLTNMTFILSFFTILCNLMTFFYVVLIITIVDHIGIYEYHIMLVNYFLLGIRHSSNFFFFYFYNVKFRFTCKKFLKRIFLK